jgi:hypothetical protein
MQMARHQSAPVAAGFNDGSCGEYVATAPFVFTLGDSPPMVATRQ